MEVLAIYILLFEVKKVAKNLKIQRPTLLAAPNTGFLANTLEQMRNLYATYFYEIT